MNRRYRRHDQIIKAEESRGYAAGVDIKGRPLDRSHPWNSKSKP
jgi:hypothetical protein